MVAYIWIIFSAMMTICNALLPTFTPVINKYAYGSGIIGSYFLSTALITSIGTVLFTIINGSSPSILLPSLPLIISGLVYGAGTLSMQKSIERAPSPAHATLLPRNRAVVNAVIAFVVFGVSCLIGQWDIYITQSLLIMIVLLMYNGYGTGGGEEHTWHVYSYMSMLLLAISDVIVKNVIGYDNILTNITWFSLSAAIIPMISLYRKTGSVIFKYREEKREDNEGILPLFLLLIGIFIIKMVSQYIAIGIAPDSANVRLIGSLAVPLTAALSHYFRGINYNVKDILIFVAFTLVGLMNGIRSLL